MGEFLFLNSGVTGVFKYDDGSFFRWVNGAQRKEDPDALGGQMAMARTHVPPRRNVKTLLETLAIAHFQ